MLESGLEQVQAEIYVSVKGIQTCGFRFASSGSESLYFPWYFPFMTVNKNAQKCSLAGSLRTHILISLNTFPDLVEVETSC